MLNRTLDFLKPLLVVLYLRMSNDDQNPRSPEQQQATIMETTKRMGYPWIVVKTYRDDGISGRYQRKRPGFTQMLSDIRTGKVKADTIVVDTIERFGRIEELPALRRELHIRHGVLILTADTQFSDPTSVAGKALATFESLRSTEDNRIKAHNVLRGKRDCIRQGHWPGGSPPFGLRLQSVTNESNGRQEFDHCILAPDPQCAPIIQRLFEQARSTGMGCSRLARMLNQDPQVPSQLKPFYDQTVNYWLQQPIYCGELV